MARTGSRPAGARACLAALLLLALPSAAVAHDTGDAHLHGATYHGDPKKALPNTLITQPVAAEELSSLEPLSVDEGTAPETWCGAALPTTDDTANAVVAAGTPHYKLVYAYAADQPNRFDTLKHRLQATVSLLQRYVAIQSDGKKALRWDMGTVCGPQYVDIQVVQLPQNRDYYVPGGAPSFERTSADVLTAIGGAGAPRNVAIYGDGLRGTNGVAGTAWRYFTSDTMATAHNEGGLAAAVYGTLTLPSSTYAEPGVMMHEIGHNLGAVADPAPHSSLAGHCHDEWDVMCYADGGARGQWSDMVENCAAIAGDVTETFDCGRDDYFNSLPAQDSYLDLNWNTYAVAHLGPCSTELVDSCGLTAPGDGTKPTNTTPVPELVWRAGFTTTLAGTDSESSVNGYQWRYGASGALGTIQHGQEATITGAHAGQVDLYDRVRDSAGNWSGWRWDPVFIDSIAPAATVTCPSTWSTTTAPICTYSVSDQGAGLHSVETQAGSDPAVPNLATGILTATADAQTVRARGRDWVANTGEWGSDTARWDRVNPTVFVSCPTDPGVRSTTCHVDASDAASGIDTVTWRAGDGAPTEVEPDSDFAVTVPGEQTITAVATDVAGRTSQATATSHVNPSAAPSGTDGTVTTNEDSPYAFTASSFGFSDPDAGDTFEAVRVDTLPATGSLTADGAAVTAGSSYAPEALRYRAPVDACGPAYASFTFSVRDSAGTYDASANTMAVDVTCVDDAPVALNDSETITEDSGATAIDVRANDTDVDGGEKVITGKTDGANGAVTITNGGLGLAYAPAGNYCGPDSFTYTLNGGSTATVSLTVTCTDDAPIAVIDVRSVIEDSGDTALSVLGNDTDVDGGTKTVLSKTSAGHGTVTVTTGGADVTYAPAADYCGPDFFTYTVNGGSTAMVNVTVTCVDDSPVAVNDSRTVDEDSGETVFDVRSNDTDGDGGPRTVESVTDGSHGQVAIANGGDDVGYIPNTNRCGDDSFSYTLNGGSTATVSVTVTCVDDPSAAVNDSNSVAQDAGATAVDVRTNDTDIDSATEMIASKTDGAHGTVAITDGGESLTYAPAAGYCGEDSFTYSLARGSTATVTITVLCNVPPIAGDDSKTVPEDSGATAIDVRANDTDTDGGDKTIESKTNGANGAVAITNSGDDLTYAPDTNYCGTDEFTYTLNGGSTATVDVTVTCVDDAPVAVNDSTNLNEDAGATTVDVRANDTDVDGGDKTIDSKTNGAHGTVAITNDGNDVAYTPAANYCGTDEFTYTLNGGSTATVSVGVACVDDAPTAINDSRTVAEDSNPTAFNVLTNDADLDAGLKTITGTTAALHGTVAVVGGATEVSYAPDANYCGDDSFSYTLNGGLTATVSVTVTCLDDAPGAVADSRTIGEDSGATTFDVRANDTDIDGGTMAIELKTNGAHGIVAITNSGQDLSYTPATNYCGTDEFTYTLNGGGTATVSVTVTCSDDAPASTNDSTNVNEDASATTIDVRANDTDPDGGEKKVTGKTNGAHGVVAITNAGDDLTYAPDANYCGTDEFTYTLNGGSTATVSVTVTCVDDAPTAVNDSKTVGQDSGATAVDVRANDTDVDGGPKTVASATNGSHGQAGVTNNGQDLIYAPAAGYCGADEFTYTLNGGSTAAVSVTVTCADRMPVAVNDSRTLEEDAATTTIDVRANDTDADGGPKTVASKTNGPHGSVAITNAGNDLAYTPAANYCGDDTFTYTLNGGSTAAVTVTVTCVDDAPTAVNDSAAAMEDVWVLAQVLPNDTDIDGGPKRIAAKTNGAHGTVALTEHGDAVAYKPVPDYCGPDRFTYTLNGGSTAAVDVAVECVDEVPSVAPSTIPPDSTPPATVIAKGPKKKVTTRSRRARVTFKLASSEPGSTFRCKLDKGRFKPCGAKTTFKLKPGRHTFVAVAVDATGNADGTPVKRKFRVVRLRSGA